MAAYIDFDFYEFTFGLTAGDVINWIVF